MRVVKTIYANSFLVGGNDEFHDEYPDSNRGVWNVERLPFKELALIDVVDGNMDRKVVQS